MGLLVWLPLMGDIHNQGLLNITTSAYGTLTYENGKLGNAVRIGEASGGTVSKGVEIDSNLIDELGTEYSCSVWVKPTGNHQNYEGCIISSGDWNNTTWSFGLNQTNTKVSVMQRGYNNYIDCEVPANTWTHLVSTAKNGVAKLYKNGEYIGSKNIANPQLVSSQSFTRIGNASYTNYFTFNGLIQDVRLYNEELDPCQIKHLSQGLVLHYPLSQPGASNMALNSNDLTLWSKEAGMTCVWDDTQQMFKIDTTTRTSSRWGIYQDVTCEPNTTYTFSVDGKKVEKTMYLSVGSFASGSVTWPSNHQQFTNKRQRLSYTFTTGDNHTVIRIYLAVYPTNEGSNAAYYAFPKLEKSDHATPWMPNSADTDYAKLGLNDNIIYDVSGYQNNGEIYKYDSNGSIECVSDTPKYILSTHINSLNPNTSAASGTVFLYGHCSITNPNQLTIAFWCKPIQGYGGNTGQGQFATTNYNIGESTAVDYLTSAMNHRDSIIDINSADGNTHIRPSIGFTANEWHHYAITYNGQTAIVYKDGIESSRKSFDTPTLLGSFIGVSIGFSKAGGVWRRNNSYYSDFRIYATALSASDILELYHTPASITNSGVLMTQGELSEV